MQISSEGEIGIVVGFLALAGGGAIMVFPDQLWIGWTMIAIAVIGFIWLGVYHFGIQPQRMTTAIGGMVVFGLSIVVIVVMGYTYVYIVRTYTPSGDLLYKGALAEIAVERPVQLADGTYSFPTLIKSVGDSSMINYYFVLSNSFWPSLLSKEQEEERFYRDTVSKFEEDRKNNPHPQMVGNVLRPGTVYRVFVPTANLTQEHYNDIASGRMYAYIFIILTYTDDKAALGDSYLAEYCGRFDPVIVGFAQCWHNNFSKRLEKKS